MDSPQASFCRPLNAGSTGGPYFYTASIDPRTYRDSLGAFTYPDPEEELEINSWNQAQSPPNHEEDSDLGYLRPGSNQLPVQCNLSTLPNKRKKNSRYLLGDKSCITPAQELRESFYADRLSLDLIIDPAPRRAPRRRKPPPVTEESIEFQRLNGLITKAWLRQDDDTGLRCALQAIKINPECFPLHAQIAEILVKKGRVQDAIGALFAGAHSSRDASHWWYVVSRLDELGGDDVETNAKLGYCYTSLLHLNQSDYNARFRRLLWYRQNDAPRRAKNDCLTLLKANPNDAQVLQHLAEVSVALNDTDKTLAHFDAFIYQYMQGNLKWSTFTWDVLVSYVNLLTSVEKYAQAIATIKRIARRKLGRSEEDFWDAYDDDREWDMEPSSRLCAEHKYRIGLHPWESYGPGLPIEVRVKLGCLRLSMTPPNVDEAKVSEIALAPASTTKLNTNQRHFKYVDAEERSEISWIREHAEVLREAAVALREAGMHRDALNFYEPLGCVVEELDSTYYFDIALCYQALGRTDDVRNSVKAIKRSGRGAEFELALAKLYQNQGKEELMWQLILELKKMGKVHLLLEAGLPTVRKDGHFSDVEGTQALENQRKTDYCSRAAILKRKRKEDSTSHQALQDAVFRALYDDLLEVREQATAGDMSCLEQWLSASSEMFEEFSAQSAFFPRDRCTKFIGFGQGRLLQMSDVDTILEAESLEFEIPTAFRLISFDEWLDLIMRYATSLAALGRARRCKKVLQASTEANIFWAEPTRLKAVKSTAIGNP